MNKKSSSELFQFLSQNLINSAHSLEPLGILELAWDYEDILHVIELASENNMIVLGGDVYKKNGEQLVVTHDSWFFDDREMPLVHMIQKSKEKALSYIRTYREKNRLDYCYSIVMTKNI